MRALGVCGRAMEKTGRIGGEVGMAGAVTVIDADFQVTGGQQELLDLHNDCIPCRNQRRIVFIFTVSH